MTETNFSIPFQAKEIKQNKPYTLKGEFTYIDTNGKKQIEKFEQDFVYKTNENQMDNIVSNLLNVPEEKEEKAEFSYLALLLLLFIILLLIFFFVIFWRRRKKKKEDDEKKTKNTDEIRSLEKGGNTHVSLK
jgi:ATP-dependent Zn protease